jgi:hypothetical protein
MRRTKKITVLSFIGRVNSGRQRLLQRRRRLRL